MITYESLDYIVFRAMQQFLCGTILLNSMYTTEVRY